SGRDRPRRRLRAARALSRRRARRPAARGQPLAPLDLVPRLDALLRRELGVERVALPRDELREARPDPARLAALPAAARALRARGGGQHGLARDGVPVAPPPGPLLGSPHPEGARRPAVPGLPLHRRRERRRLGRRLELRRRAPLRPPPA